MADADGYGGVIGAIPYAFRRSDSRLFRLYVVVSTVAVAVLTLWFLFALVVLVGRTASVQGGSLTLSRTFYILVALFVVAPLLAPTLFVARRHRRGLPVRDGYDALLAVAGFLFLASLYLGLVAAMPETWHLDGDVVHRPPPSTAGAFAPVVALLYAFPSVLSPLVPLAVALTMYLTHRTLRA